MKRKPIKRLFALVLVACLLLAGLPLSAGAAGSPSVSGSNPFRDVASGDYFYRPVLWAVRNNITAGTSATTFSPNDGCTRGRSSPSCISTTLPERGKESSPPGLPEGSFCVYFSR